MNTLGLKMVNPTGVAVIGLCLAACQTEGAMISIDPHVLPYLDAGTPAPMDAGHDSALPDSGGPSPSYYCVEEVDIDPARCGPYPEAEGWDLGKVVTNLSFEAYYDRDCDGVPEPTQLNMYRDVYCARDHIKSIVMLVDLVVTIDAPDSGVDDDAGVPDCFW